MIMLLVGLGTCIVSDAQHHARNVYVIETYNTSCALFFFPLPPCPPCSPQIWLDLFADELVALVETLGVETSMKPAILGLTLLAIGNSVGDFVADTAFARDGNPQMGLSSCFGSPMFNDVIGNFLTIHITLQGMLDKTTKIKSATDHSLVGSTGLGIALSISCAKAGGGSKPLLVRITKELYLSWGFLLVSLTCSLSAFIGFGFQPPLRAHAYFLCGLYGVFFVFVVAMQFGLAV